MNAAGSDTQNQLDSLLSLLKRVKGQVHKKKAADLTAYGAHADRPPRACRPPPLLRAALQACAAG
eukprot:6209527-Pleurochrysis_carterae.AAC.1